MTRFPVSKSLFNLNGDSVPPLGVKARHPDAWWTAFLLAHHDAINQRFYKGALETPQIEVVHDEETDALGIFTEDYAEQPIILINIGLLKEIAESEGIESIEDFALDVLLHEIVHEYVAQIGRDTDEDDHDNPAFVAEAARLSAALELEPPDAADDSDEEDDEYYEPGENLDREDGTISGEGGYAAPRTPGARPPKKKRRDQRMPKSGHSRGGGYMGKNYDFSGWPMTWREDGFYDRHATTRKVLNSAYSLLAQAEKAVMDRFNRQTINRRALEVWAQGEREQHAEWLEYVRDMAEVGEIDYDVSELKSASRRRLKPC
jgi:hypothetical protein